MEQLTGRVDHCDPEGVKGWVVSTVQAAKRLEIEVLADGHPVARAVADRFRPDLMTAGIGDGLHGFKVALPAVLFDDNEHIIEVREVSTGCVLQGSPRTFRATLAGHGNIRLLGSALIGWAKLPEGFEASPALEVMDGEQAIGVVEGAADGAVASVVHFRFSLPLSVLDGYLHHFSIRSMPGTSPPVPLGNLTVVTPVRPGLESA